MRQTAPTTDPSNGLTFFEIKVVKILFAEPG